MQAIAGRFGISEATVGAIAAGCDAVLMCGAEIGSPGGGARGGHSRGRGRHPPGKARGRRARAAPAGEGAVSRAAPPAPLTGAALRQILGRDEHQAVADADGEVRLTHAPAARADVRRPRRRSWRPPARSRATSSTRGLAELRSLGFDPVYEPSVFARTGYVAGPAADRAAALQRAWADPSIAALIAVRGGYGSVAAVAAARPRPSSTDRRRRSSATATTRRCCPG